mmetsp:Transcript_55531/g.92326  ORF Transcript_55531/g.92326 Transcript_55531/m.92326 type:complete len:115 (+) Transcript_55531:110-454(+)
MTQNAINNKNNGKYLDLYISCPACGKGSPSKWLHADLSCLKHTEINEYGYVRCKNAHGAPFFDWRWNCGKHNGQYQQANPEYLASAFMHLINGMPVKDFKWYAQLIGNVEQQFA